MKRSTRNLLAVILSFLLAFGSLFPGSAAVKISAAGIRGLSGYAEDITGNTQADRISKYGNVYLDITTEDFFDSGYNTGDIVCISFLDEKLEVPVGTAYSDVDIGEPVLIAKEGTYLEIAIRMGDFASSYGIAKENVSFEISLKKAGGYLAEYEVRHLEMTNDRADYPDLSDAEFANFRLVATKGMGKGILYRTSSPVMDTYGRNTYADDCLKAAGVTVAVNLDQEPEDISGTYYSAIKHVLTPITVDLSSEANRKGLADAYKYMAKNPGVYSISCIQGKDRAGIAVAVLECFMGASGDEVIEDYMKSFENYYGVLKGEARYDKLCDSFEEQLAGLLDVTSLSDADLSKKAALYLKSIGLSYSERKKLKKNLSASFKDYLDPELTAVNGAVLKITKKSRVSQDDMKTGYNRFTVNILKEIVSSEEKGKNVMISPASLVFALDMAAMGAKGKTYRQIASLICKGASKKDMDLFTRNYGSSLSEGSYVDIANSVWINENNLRDNNIRVNEKYLNLLKKNYGAAAASLPFDKEAQKRINAWIESATDGMIKKALGELSDESLMLLINAITFEGEWKKEYKNSQVNENGKFTNYEGKIEEAKMMSSEENIYLKACGATGFLKYYKGGKYAFMAMLPDDKDVKISEFIGDLPEDAFESFYNSREYAEVDTVTPAFEFDYGTELNDALKKLGMKKAFDKDADLKLMIDPETINPLLEVYVSSVIQKTHIELDEKGTKAAAVTIIDIRAETTSVRDPEPRKKVILNRPFVFAIVDTASGTPVFIGAVNTVK